MSIYETHLPQTLWYSNITNIISNALKLTFRFIHSSLVIIHQFTWMVWFGVTAVHSCLECGLLLTSLSPLLKCITHCLTVLTSTVWSKCLANVDEWQGVQFFSVWRNLMLYFYFIQTLMSDTILPDFQSTAICNRVKKLWLSLARRFNFYCHNTNIHLWYYGMTLNKWYYFHSDPYR